MEYVMKRDSLTIRKIERRISQLETAISYTKKSTRVNQNNKMLVKLNKELNNAVYQHNKFDLFKVLEKQLDEELTKQLEKQFASL